MNRIRPMTFIKRSMRLLAIVSLVNIFAFDAVGQEDIEAVKKQIVADGNWLFENIHRSELLLSTYRQNHAQIIKLGCLSYTEDNKTIGIVFHLHSDSSSVLMSSEFYDDSIVHVDSVRRMQTSNE